MEQKDGWIGDVFYHYGVGYITTPTGGIKIIPSDNATNAPDNQPERQEPVSKIPDNDIPLTDDIQEQPDGIMKHRGRPKKEGKISRTTRWRRQKDGNLQGVMF